jgi:hypothetical protein
VSDHADIVREALACGLSDADGWREPEDVTAALAALDALVAERDEAIDSFDNQRHRAEAAEARVEALEAGLGVTDEIIDGLVAERDEAVKGRTLAAEWFAAERARAEASEAEVVVQHQRLLDLDETLTAEIRGAVARVTELEQQRRELYSEVDCRIEHGADSNGHLEYVRAALGEEG